MILIVALFRGLTRCGLLKQRLQMSRKLHNVIRRPRPKDQAVARVLEARFHLWIFQSQEKWVNNELLEVGSNKLLLLLLIPLRSVSLVKSLDLCLRNCHSSDLEALFLQACIGG